MRKLSIIFLVAIIFFVYTTNTPAKKNGNEVSSGKRAKKAFDITVKAWGPTQEDVETAKNRVKENPLVRNKLKSTKHFLIDFESVYKNTANKNSLPPTHFQVYFYDYTNNKTIIAKGDFAGKEKISMSESDVRRDVSASFEEIKAGFELVKNDSRLGSLLKANKLKLFEPMPPVTYLNSERLINIGIKYIETGIEEIVGASFRHSKIIHYGREALPTGESGGSCGVPNSGQGSSPSGNPGQYDLTVTKEGLPLWEMRIIRPSFSSGRSSERSGIEIRNVKFKGKSVLKRGHAPILNVNYRSGCGAFRDWQSNEGYFDAPEEGSQNPAPAIRILAEGEVATTVVESGVDAGNFHGVAIYQTQTNFGNELVLVSEMNAGWYRYIMEWRFHEDGTIRPRYGFGSVQNSCVCSPRDHHIYWRFDFDIVNSENDVYKVERGRRFLTPITNEAKIFRNYQTNRSILIKNSNGDEAYQLTPNITDEEAYVRYSNGHLETFGAGDLWIMQFKGTPEIPQELDDPNTSPAANLDPWINDESIGNNDVVVWYGAHQFRDDATSLTNFDRSGLVLGGVHVVGPDLRPVRW